MIKAFQRIQIKLTGNFGKGGDQFVIVRVDKTAYFGVVVPRLQITTRFAIFYH